jgi:NitT/TauT family transport system ATP-binding protein
MAPEVGASSSPLLEVANVGLVYDSSTGDVEALRSISFSVKEGEFVSILGPSGCGKSSLLKLVLGLETATSGEVSISGNPINGPTKNVGCVFQSPVLLPWRNVRDNVLLPADVMKLDRAFARTRAEGLLQLVGLAGFEDRYPYELSGGMQQRASIVRALVHDPHILLMDEPFAALDAITREQMAMELQRIWMASRKTLLFITHAVAEAALLSDRIIVMSARPGRILEIYENKAERPRSFADLGGTYINRLMDEIRECLTPNLNN